MWNIDISKFGSIHNIHLTLKPEVYVLTGMSKPKNGPNPLEEDFPMAIRAGFSSERLPRGSLVEIKPTKPIGGPLMGYINQDAPRRHPREDLDWILRKLFCAFPHISTEEFLSALEDVEQGTQKSYFGLYAKILSLLLFVPKAGIVVFTYPDRGIHPRADQGLLSIFRRHTSGKCLTFIIITRSPEIWKGFAGPGGMENILLLRSDSLQPCTQVFPNVTPDEVLRNGYLD